MQQPALARNADGDPAIRIGNVVHAYVPTRAGFALASHYTPLPPESCRRSDFIVSLPLVDETAFLAEIESMLLHQEQLKTLGRTGTAWRGWTPWGSAQEAMRYGDGVVSVSTPGHGGFLLDEARNQEVHPAWRNDDRAYEEDCDWAIVTHTFPDLFTDRERSQADSSLRRWRPDEYMAVTGIRIDAAESHILSEREFLSRNADRYVVISARASKEEGMIACTATRGGVRRDLDKAPVFLVPAEEYAGKGPHGFVIDEDRHVRDTTVRAS